MQTNALPLASGIPRLVPVGETATGRTPGKGTKMAKSAAITYAPTGSLLARLMTAIDRALSASARIAVRNGDLPRFGL
jgi:hypothetical protein